jgi:hypothetical protein
MVRRPQRAVTVELVGAGLDVVNITGGMRA